MGIGQRLEQSDSCLVAEGATRAMTVLLLVPFLPERAEYLQRPVIQQCGILLEGSG